MSEFFIILITMSQIHSSSPADMLQLFAVSARAPQNCSNGSRSLCFLFSNLCLSNVTFVFLTTASERFSQNSLKEIWRILTLVIFWPNIFFLRFRGLNKGQI